MLVFVVPFVFACAHATTGEMTDGLNAAATEPAESTFVLQEPPVLQVATDAQTAVARKQVAKEGKAHKKAQHPFSKPTPSRTVASAKVSHVPDTLVVKPLNDKPANLVIRNGSLLNRYYFLRSADTPEALSTLFYGSADRASELVEWNGPAQQWKAGTVLYYRSGKNPEEGKMLSYYFEAGIKTEEVSLGEGETLRTLAERKYGSAESWREIAVLNNVRPEAQPSAGTLLKMYPSSLVSNLSPVVAKIEAMKPISVPTENKTAWFASAQLTAFIQHNPLVVACGSVALVLLLAFFFVQRRRYRSRFDF